MIGFRESAAAELMEFVVFSAQLKEMIAIGAVISRVCSFAQLQTGTGVDNGQEASQPCTTSRYISSEEESDGAAGSRDSSQPATRQQIRRGRRTTDALAAQQKRTVDTTCSQTTT